MQPAIPQPYGYAGPAQAASPLLAARRVRTADGAQIATFVYGPQDADLARALSDPVLMLHGNGGSHGSFACVTDLVVAAGKGVVSIDTRAQGQSSRGCEPLTYELFAHDALCVLDELGIDAAHVLGYSDGGIEALLMARDCPDRVRSIVTCGANLTPDGVVDEWDTPASAAANRAWGDWVGADGPSGDIDLSLLPSAEDAMRAAELLQLMVDEPNIPAASLSAIRCPACIMVGERDCIKEEETKAIVDAIPNSRLVVVDGAGHSLPRQAPEAVALQVLTNVLLSL